MPSAGLWNVIVPFLSFYPGVILQYLHSVYTISTEYLYSIYWQYVLRPGPGAWAPLNEWNLVENKFVLFWLSHDPGLAPAAICRGTMRSPAEPRLGQTTQSAAPSSSWIMDICTLEKCFSSEDQLYVTRYGHILLSFLSLSIWKLATYILRNVPDSTLVNHSIHTSYVHVHTLCCMQGISRQSQSEAEIMCSEGRDKTSLFPHHVTIVEDKISYSRSSRNIPSFMCRWRWPRTG